VRWDMAGADGSKKIVRDVWSQAPDSPVNHLYIQEWLSQALFA
jgi:hypothetical protein